MEDPVDKMNRLIATDPKLNVATELESLKRAVRTYIGAWNKHEQCLCKQGPISEAELTRAYEEKAAAFRKLKELVD